MTRFEADSAVAASGPGRWSGECTDEWSAPPGPNGGYLAAIVLRAMQEAVGADGSRPARSLTLHYLRPTRPGPLEVIAEVAREGRSLTTVTARLEQEGVPKLLALGAFAGDFASPIAYAPDPPDVAPAELNVAPADAPLPPIAKRFAMAPVIGPPVFSGADEALVGGWIAFAGGEGPSRLDAPALALLTDAWLPAPFARLTEIAPAPTIDLTVHFRAPEVEAEGPVLGVWRSRALHGGYFEEDGELWSADGTLLAQSRQLALLRAPV